MLDVFYVSFALALFGLSIGLVKLFEKL